MAGFTIPNLASAPFPAQAEPDSGDIEALARAFAGTGAVTGCAVTAQGPPNLSVVVAPGTVTNGGTLVTVAGANPAVAAGHALLPRLDLVTVTSAGTVVVTTGTAAAHPAYPGPMAAGSVLLAAVLVPPLASAILSSHITDKRVAPTLGADVMRTSRAYGAVPTGANVAAELQLWANAQAANAGAGILPPGTYGQSSQLSLISGLSVSAYGAKLLAPVASAFNMVKSIGSSPSHVTDVVIQGLHVDMRATVLTVNGNAFYLLYTDDGRLIDVHAANAAFEGILIGGCARTWLVRPRCTGSIGDGIHFEDSTDWWVIHPSVSGVGTETGIATTGAATARGRILEPLVDGHNIGIGISGGNDISVRGGHVRNVVIGLKVEAAAGVDSYDITVDGTKVSDVDQSSGYGVAISEPNRAHSSHPIVFRHGEIDAGARPAFSIASAGDVLIEDQIIRTTGIGVILSGTAPKPGGTTRLRRCTFIGCSTAVQASAGAFSGTLLYEDCTFVGVTTKFSDPAFPQVIDDTGWVTLTPNAGWSSGGGGFLRYRKLRGVVYVQVSVVNTSGVSNGTVIATLPSGALPDGARPDVQPLVVAAYGRLKILADGSVQPFDPVAIGDGILATLTFPV